MASNDPLYKAVRVADQKDQIGYARHLCEIYLQKHPEDVTILIRYACGLISLAQYHAATTALEKAQSIVSKKRLHLVLAQRGHLLEAQGDFQAAEEMFLRAHDLDSDDANYLNFAAGAAFRRGDIDRAQKLAGRATDCSQGSIVEAWFNLGGYLLSAKRYCDAADCYRKALEIDPDYAIARERLDDVELIIRHEG